jgi:hypothetical protein
LRGSASSPALATSLTLNSSQRLPLSPTTSFPAIGHYHKRTANFELQQNAHAIRSFAHLPDGLSAKARAALAAEQVLSFILFFLLVSFVSVLDLVLLVILFSKIQFQNFFFHHRVNSARPR